MVTSKRSLRRRLSFSDALRDFCNWNENGIWSLRNTQFNFPWWKFFPTKSYKMLAHWEDYIYETVLEMVAEYADDHREETVYNFILTANIDEREKTGAIIDFISAGIHTLKNSLVFLLHMVAEHPEFQEIIAQDLNYAKACMNETFRLLPTATPLSRITEHDMDLGGYQVKAGSIILCHGEVAC